MKYRPVMSYCWWFTVAGIYDFLFSMSLVTLLVVTWPSSSIAIVRLGIALVLLSIPNSLRTLCFHRTDETLMDRIILVLIRPIAAAWSSIVLARIIRVWGTATLMRQGWTTRQNGAELVLDPEHAAPLPHGQQPVEHKADELHPVLLIGSIESRVLVGARDTT
jgi:hypothetical protein